MKVRGYQHQDRGQAVRPLVPGLGDTDDVETIVFGDPPERRVRSAVKVGPVVFPVGRWGEWQPRVRTVDR